MLLVEAGKLPLSWRDQGATFTKNGKPISVKVIVGSQLDTIIQHEPIKRSPAREDRPELVGYHYSSGTRPTSTAASLNRIPSG